MGMQKEINKNASNTDGGTLPSSPTGSILWWRPQSELLSNMMKLDFGARAYSHSRGWPAEATQTIPDNLTRSSCLMQVAEGTDVTVIHFSGNPYYSVVHKSLSVIYLLQ